jgi:hypothetical protein
LNDVIGVGKITELSPGRYPLPDYVVFRLANTNVLRLNVRGWCLRRGYKFAAFFVFFRYFFF